MYICANSVDSDQTAPKEQSDQNLHCLPFCLHHLEALLHLKSYFILKVGSCPNDDNFVKIFFTLSV